MKHCFLKLTALLFLLVSAMPSMANDVYQSFLRECQTKLPQATVNVIVSPIRITQNFDYSMYDLTYRMEKPRIQVYDANASVVMGMVRANSSVSTDANMKVFGSEKINQTCARPEVNIRMNFEDMMFYVAREFPRGSCSFAEVYNHEVKHVNTYHFYLAKAADEVKARVLHAVGNKIYYNSTSKDAEYIRDVALHIAKEYMKMVEDYQAQIDNHEEYDRVASSCNGEVKAVIDQLLIRR